MCKYYQNITSRLVFMIVFGIYCNFLIVLPIRLETCKSNIFLLFTRQKLRAQRIGHVSEVLRTSTPVRHRARNLSRPEKINFHKYNSIDRKVKSQSSEPNTDFFQQLIIKFIYGRVPNKYPNKECLRFHLRFSVISILN